MSARKLAACALAACSLHAGCESCDFSLGLIPLEIHLDPPDTVAVVTVCDKEGQDNVCTTMHLPADPSDPPRLQSRTPDPPEPGTIYGESHWDGYAVCRYPGLEIDVEADGCAPKHVSVEKRAPKGREKLRVDIALDCD